MTRDADATVGPVFVGSVEIETEPLPGVIDTERFTPRLLHLLSNALVWRESRLLRAAFNLGTNDWRVISAIAIRPGATSTDISEFVAMNKAIVSKSVNTLIARELIVPADGRRGSRHLYLTRAGADMHHRMKPISLEGQQIVLADLSDAEVDQLNDLLTRLLLKTPELSVNADDHVAGED
ncbi:MarR family winged helix-turn-helix transcriptional regulator [Microbacterium sp. P01]|uniref:MarR family winged helix-turn-helix transcriptional regulator n=1 Tax=unclassified Microbacterium TaxID=2609290 RepID=UPI00366D5637